MPTDAESAQLNQVLSLLEQTLRLGREWVSPKARDQFEAAVTELTRREFPAIRQQLVGEDEERDRRLDDAGLTGQQLTFKQTALEEAVTRVKEDDPPDEKRQWYEIALDVAKTIGLSVAEAFNLGSALKELIELLHTGLKSDIVQGTIEEIPPPGKGIRRRLRRLVERFRRPDRAFPPT